MLSGTGNRPYRLHTRNRQASSSTDIHTYLAVYIPSMTRYHRVRDKTPRTLLLVSSQYLADEGGPLNSYTRLVTYLHSGVQKKRTPSQSQRFFPCQHLRSLHHRQGNFGSLSVISRIYWDGSASIALSVSSLIQARKDGLGLPVSFRTSLYQRRWQSVNAQ